MGGQGRPFRLAGAPASRHSEWVSRDRQKALGLALQSALETISHWSEKASVQVADKANSADPVTECDLASEEAIIREIRARFPDDEILSEEMPDSHDKLDDPDWSGWVLDPLDGTYNFSRRIPYFSSSVAWVKHGELALGGIADPNRGQVYTASRGGGTWLDGKRLAVSAKSDFGPGTRVATSNIVAGEGTQTNL